MQTTQNDSTATAAMPADLARAILLADECAPLPLSAVEALRSMRRALAAERGVKVTDLVREAMAHVRVRAVP